MFKNIDVVYSVIAVNMYGTSYILNMTVLQDFDGVESEKVMGGNVFLRVFAGVKFFLAVQILHSVNREPCCPTTILFVPVFTLNLVHIYEGKVHLKGLNIHVNTEKHELLEILSLSYLMKLVIITSWLNG